MLLTFCTIGTVVEALFLILEAKASHDKKNTSIPTIEMSVLVSICQSKVCPDFVHVPTLSTSTEISIGTSVQGKSLAKRLDRRCACRHQHGCRIRAGPLH